MNNSVKVVKVEVYIMLSIYVFCFRSSIFTKVRSQGGLPMKVMGALPITLKVFKNSISDNPGVYFLAKLRPLNYKS